MSTATLISLFGQKAWANRELFATLATVPEAQAASLHTCLRTLNHIHVVDRLFRAHLSGEPRPFDATNTAATPTLAQLRDDVAATDAWYCGHVAGLGPGRWPRCWISTSPMATAAACRARRSCCT